MTISVRKTAILVVIVIVKEDFAISKGRYAQRVFLFKQSIISVDEQKSCMDLLDSVGQGL